MNPHFFRSRTGSGRGRAAAAAAVVAGTAVLGLGLGAGTAVAADMVSVGAATVDADDVSVSVAYRCAAGVLAVDVLKVSVANTTTGGVFRVSERPRCDGVRHEVDVVASRAAGPAPAVGDSVVVTAALGTGPDGLLFFPVASTGGSKTLR